MDLLACLPVSYIQQLVESSHGSGGSDDHLKLLKSLRLFRLAKLLRLARFRRLIKRWEVRSDPPASLGPARLCGREHSPLCSSAPLSLCAVPCCSLFSAAVANPLADVSALRCRGRM